MIIKIKNNYKFFIILAQILLFSTSCTHYYEQPIYDIDLKADNDKIKFPIEIVYTDEFRNAQINEKKMGDTYIVPLGENLVFQTNKLIESLFSNPKMKDDDNSNDKKEVYPEYLFKPNVSYIKRTDGVTTVSEAKFSIGIEWKIYRRSGELIWAETVSGSGASPNGHPLIDFDERQQERISLALEDLFTKTQRVISSSSLLRALNQP